MPDNKGKIGLPQMRSDTHMVTGVLAAFITAFILSTRILTAFQSYQSQEEAKKGLRPPRVPYWIPLLGSLPSSWLGAESFLSQSKYAPDCALSFPTLTIQLENSIQMDC